MKNIRLILALPLLLLFSCSKYNDSSLQTWLDNIEDRIDALEQRIDSMNTNINSLQQLATVYSSGDYISGVEEVVQDGVLIGYKVSFSNSNPIIIYTGQNGKDGVDGTDGADGADGSSPVVSVTLVNGTYYWTVDGEILKDASGNNLPASADSSNVTSGNGSTPVVSIVDGQWVVTVDGITSVVGNVVDTESKVIVDGVFSSVSESDSDVSFTLSDGTVIVIPKLLNFAIKLSESSSRVIGYTAVGAVGAVQLNVLNAGNWGVSVSASSDTTGTITLSEPSPIEDAVFYYLATDGNSSATGTFSVTDGVLSL